MADIAGKLCLIDDHLREQCLDVDVRGADCCELTCNPRFGRRRVQRPLHRQFDGSSWFRHAHELAAWRRLPHCDGMYFYVVENIHDAAILKISLIVHETSKLL